MGHDSWDELCPEEKGSKKPTALPPCHLHPHHLPHLQIGVQLHTQWASRCRLSAVTALCCMPWITTGLPSVWAGYVAASPVLHIRLHQKLSVLSTNTTFHPNRIRFKVYMITPNCALPLVQALAPSNNIKPAQSSSFKQSGRSPQPL